MRTLCFYGALSTVICAALGCGDPFQAGTGGAAGGTGPGSTSSGSGGAGGASSSSSGGGGGQGGCNSCRPGEYCRGETCESCADFDGVVAFGTPVPVEVSGVEPAFPRVSSGTGPQGTGERLVYAARFSGSNIDLGLAEGQPWDGGTPLASVQINSTYLESGPLLLPEGAEVGGLPGGSLFFDGRSRFDDHRRIFGAASLDPMARQALADVNIGKDSYSLAVAHAITPQRYWFMNKASDMAGVLPQLVTKIAGDPVTKPLNIPLVGACESSGDDLAPWVTPDGTRLFFQSRYASFGSCDASFMIRSFVVKLGSDGLPESGAEAELLLPTFAVGKQVLTPSLSTDMCTLYFASDVDGEQKIYAAPRK